MSLLRIYASVTEPPQRCQWALLDTGREIESGEGRLTDLPTKADRVQLVIPADQVLITRTRLPSQAKRRGGAVLAFAIEEQTLGEPDNNQVNWLGTVGNETEHAVGDPAGEEDVLAVVDKQGLLRWRNALSDAGINDYELHSEIHLLPTHSGEWSLAWNGVEGFVRIGDLEGAATDCGDREAPPLSLRLLLDEADAQGVRPNSIALYTKHPDAAPDLDEWQNSLGLPVRVAGAWDWRTAPADTGVGLAQERQGWRTYAKSAVRLRPAALILAGALAIHACALTLHWVLLAREQRALRQNMEVQFRAVFPDALAVVDPVLQMRRKLAEARHSAGVPDEGDFLPMIERVASGLGGLPEGNVRVVSYESGRLSLELGAIEESAARQILKRLTQAGLNVEASPALTPAMTGGEGGESAPQGKTQPVTLIVRAS
jgi:general secretion pathway protein L